MRVLRLEKNRRNTEAFIEVKRWPTEISLKHVVMCRQKSVRIFIAENDMCSSGLGLYLDEGSKANVIGLRHIDSVSVNFCFHCGKSAKEILKKIGKEGNPRFGCDSELKVDDEMDDVSDWAKDAAKKLTEAK